MTLSMTTAAILNLDAKFCTRKSDFSHGDFLRSLIQPETKIQRPFELKDIYCDWINYEISGMDIFEKIMWLLCKIT